LVNLFELKNVTQNDLPDSTH